MHYLGIILFFCATSLTASPLQEPEIIIELTGTPDTAKTTDIDIWDKNTSEITRLFAQKTREQALAQITSVSTKDTNVLSADGKKYRFVQYGQKTNYRKFLFRAQEPQTFVAVATDTKDSLALFETYQVDIDLSENEFLETYAKQAASVFLPVPQNQTLYQITLKNAKPQFFLFKQGKLAQILTKNQADELVKSQEKSLQTPAQSTPKKSIKKVRKALVSGGTLHDQMYMPRVVSSSQTQFSISSPQNSGKHTL